jgi:integrase
MAKTIKRLKATDVAKAAPGMHPDGGGLYLAVSPTGARSWILRYQLAGRRRDMGLGPCTLVPLSEAREKATAALRRIKLDHVDPLADKVAKVSAPTTVTFEKAAEAYIAAHRAGWDGPTSEEQWRQTLTTYAYPQLGKMAVSAIDTAAMLRVLQPIWEVKSVTAQRVQNRINLILDMATARGWRSGDNPARWEGHLRFLLPSLVLGVKHHKALPYAELPAFFDSLPDSIHTQALRFIILTAVELGPVLRMTWDQVDLERRLWTIPGTRMRKQRKASDTGVRHVVPLSDAAVALLGSLLRNGDKVFATSPASVQRLVKGVCTVHGMRSSFKDWCTENGISRDLSEMALAHELTNATEAAYNRTNLVEQRRPVMQAWADFCTGIVSDNVIQLRA